MIGESIQILNLLQDPKLIESLAKEELKIVQKYKPDAVVVDYRPSAVIPPTIKKLPTFLITGSTGSPYGFFLPKFINIPDALFKMLVTPFVHALITLAKYRYFLLPTYNAAKRFDPDARLSETIDRIHYLIVEEPNYLSNEIKRNNVHYIGHTIWKGFQNHVPSWMRQISPNGKTVYVSFGGTGFDKRKLIAITKILIQKGYRVIVSCGTIAEPKEFPKLKDLFVEKFLPGREISKKVDLVVCHGGFGTVIETAIAGKPFISLPFNPDQLLHSLRLQELGLGICISNSTFQNLKNALSPDWTSFQNMSSRISIEKVLSAVETIFVNYEDYKKRAEAYSKTLTTDGDKKAADVIEKVLKVN